MRRSRLATVVGLTALLAAEAASLREAAFVVAVTSLQHFRAAFEPIAGRVIVCDSGALAIQQAHLRPDARVGRPIWPLDRGTTWP